MGWIGWLKYIKGDPQFGGNVTVDGTLSVTGNLSAPQAPAAITDPGTGAAIPVTGSGTVAITTGGSSETNTVAIPTFLGQRLVLTLDVDGGGDRVITFASAINVAGNTIATFGTARQTLVVEAIQIAGALAWEVTANNGSVALS